MRSRRVRRDGGGGGGRTVDPTVIAPLVARLAEPTVAHEDLAVGVPEPRRRRSRRARAGSRASERGTRRTSR